MRKGIVILTALSIMAAVGCKKKSQTMDDQLTAPVDTVQEPVAPPVPEAESEPEIDSAAILEQQFQDDVEMTLVPIYFLYDSYALSEESRNTLAKIGQFMRSYGEVQLQVEGHCDERGSSEYNMALGQRRADEAKRYLVTFGVPSSRITTLSWGEEKPEVQGNNENAWAKNRRDEFTYKR